jgi:tetraacyldisaccharide 4'-kinase
MHHQHTSWLQRLLENIWYQQGKGKWFLLPFTLMYCILHSFQRWKLTRKRSKITIPVVIIGNISIGGTGKTPTVIYLAKLLIKAGYKPAIITRGYGGTSTKWPQEVTVLSNPKEVGDEAVLLAKRTKLPVIAGADRYLDIQYLRSRYDCDVILSDDGLQHYPLHRDIEIILIDAERQLGNGWCIPAGPLRENTRRLKKVDFVLFNYGLAKSNPQKDRFAKQYQLESLFSMNLSGKRIYSLLGKKTPRYLTELEGQTVHVVTGIGNPSRFYSGLEQLGLHLIKHSFPDHHNFTQKELHFNDDKTIIMTEKDAVKCQQFSIKNCWYLPIEAHIENEFDRLFMDKLKRLKNG